MRITAIRETVVPIRSAIRNACIAFTEMNVSAVAIHTDITRRGRALVGYGFHSNGRYAQRGILRERLIPRLLRAAPEELLDETGRNFDPGRAWQVMMTDEKPGGHGERSVAVGALDMALWDLVGKLAERPLCQVLANRYRQGKPDPRVYVYAAGGYYHPGKNIAALLEEIRGYLEQGYTTVKIKIGGGSLAEDLRRIEAVLALLSPGQQLAVDANGRFDLPTALACAQALNAYPLKWYEEPCDPLDFEMLRQVARASKNPLATGENLFSCVDSRNLIRYGGLSAERNYLQMDPALSYGLVEYVRILEMLREHGWSAQRCLPHGGHQMALHIAAGFDLHGSESYPGVFRPFGGFADGIPVVNGRVELPDAPGIGIECKRELHQVFRAL